MCKDRYILKTRDMNATAFYSPSPSCVFAVVEKMYRSASTFRSSSEEHLLNLLPALAANGSSPVKTVAGSPSELPVAYSPVSEGSKKELGALQQHKPLGGENGVHLIPVVLFLCGLALWLFCPR
ncbi:unnamed protein product [Linum tenue]|uniref:Uncharacterized protein n=1 Tax=Linum tenue TaxID=586396 RepID=A0AAV0HYZ3_9ROSI|nr:unnamed protein product [Linum tenue]